MFLNLPLKLIKTIGLLLWAGNHQSLARVLSKSQSWQLLSSQSVSVSTTTKTLSINWSRSQQLEELLVLISLV